MAENHRNNRTHLQLVTFAIMSVALAGCSASASGSGDEAAKNSSGSQGTAYGDAYLGESNPGSYAENEPDPVDGDKFEAVGTNPFVVVSHDPLSTFAADVDTASYDLFRSRTEQGFLIDSASVRLEEFVNYFDYDYPAPSAESSTPFSIHLAAAPNLATRNTQLLRVGIQGKVISEKKPTNLVYLIDVSGSMAAEMNKVQAVLRSSVDLLAPDDTISIVTYASNPGTALAATPVSQKSKIISAIDALSSGGSTNGAGGIEAAYKEAQSVFIEGGINHVLLCTDGDFNVGPASTDELEELIIEKRKTGITLTALGFGAGNYNDAMMERVSNAGNGIYAYIGSEESAEKYVENRMLQSLVHIAKDMKIQVEFNPAHVYAYRLLGYENRAIADNDFRNDVVDAGEIGSGHRVTALYELVFEQEQLPMPTGAPALDDGEASTTAAEVAPEDLVLVKVRYKEPNASETDAALEVSERMSPQDVASGFDSAEGDLQYAAAVAAFAEVLKKSPYADSSSMTAIRLILDAQKSKDDDRAELLELFDLAEGLLNSSAN